MQKKRLKSHHRAISGKKHRNHVATRPPHSCGDDDGQKTRKIKTCKDRLLVDTNPMSSAAAAATSFAFNTVRALRRVTRTTNTSSRRITLTRANATMSVTTADDFPKGVSV